MYIVLNTLTPGHSGYATVISSHRTLEAAERAERACQPPERNFYLPTCIMVSPRRCSRGQIVSVSDLADVQGEEG